MVSLISISKAQQKLAELIRERRLQMELTQAGLAERSGVTLATLRKYEQKGVISLESFLRLLRVVGGMDELLDSLELPKQNFKSIDEVLKGGESAARKRGRRK